MNKIIITFNILLVSTICFSQNEQTDSIQEAYMKSNKKAIEKASPMIDFFLKYQDSSKTPSQADFSKLISVYKVEKDNNQALSEEQAFSIIDDYIKASEGGKEKPEKETIDETESGNFPKTEEEKLKEKAEEELPGQIKSIITGISYDEFKKMMQMVNPNATDTEIKTEYEKFKNSSKKI